MSLMSAWAAGSSVASGGMTPSPLSGLEEKILAVLPLSSAEMTVASRLPATC